MEFERASAVLVPWYVTHWRGKSRPLKYHAHRVHRAPKVEGAPAKYHVVNLRTHVTRRRIFKDPALKLSFIDPSIIFPGILDMPRKFSNTLWMNIPWGQIYHPKVLTTPKQLHSIIHQTRTFYRQCASNYILVELDARAVNPNVTKKTLLSFLKSSLEDAPYDIKWQIQRHGTASCRRDLYRLSQLPRLSPHVRDLKHALHSAEERAMHPEDDEIYQRVYEDLVSIGYRFGIFPAIECSSWDEYERETCKAVRFFLKEECAPTPVDDVLLLVSKHLPFKMETMMTMTHSSLNKSSCQAAIYQLRRFDPKISDRAVDILTANPDPRVVHTHISQYMQRRFFSTTFNTQSAEMVTFNYNLACKAKDGAASSIKAYDMFTQQWDWACVAVARLVTDPTVKLHRFCFFQPFNFTQVHINRFFGATNEPEYPPEGPLEPVELMHPQRGCFVLRNAAASDLFLSLLEKYPVTQQGMGLL